MIKYGRLKCCTGLCYCCLESSLIQTKRCCSLSAQSPGKAEAKPKNEELHFTDHFTWQSRNQRDQRSHSCTCLADLSGELLDCVAQKRQQGDDGVDVREQKQFKAISARDHFQQQPEQPRQSFQDEHWSAIKTLSLFLPCNQTPSEQYLQRLSAKDPNIDDQSAIPTTDQTQRLAESFNESDWP